MPRVKSEETREAIRKAAIELIAVEGFYNCNTDKIARVAGISVGTIYNYFQNKEEILSDIFIEEVNKLEAFFQGLESSGGSITDKIKIFLVDYFRGVLENRKLARLLFNESSRPLSCLTEEIIKYTRLLHGYLKKLIQQGIESGEISRQKNPEIIAAAILGGVSFVALGGYLNPDDLEDICRNAPVQLSNLFLKGLTNS